MSENAELQPSPEIPIAPVARPAQPSPLERIFIGPNGLRAGWRFAMYLLLVAALSYLTLFILHHFFPRPKLAPGAPFVPERAIISKLIEFLLFAIPALIMAKIEGASWGAYGLPLKQAFRGRFWFGMAWGFVGLSFIMMCLHLCGAYRIEGLAIHGMDIARYAVLWGVVFLLVGFGEEFALRGYTQYTLASGMGFWPATIVMSALFLSGHIRNPGETWIGLTDVFLFGMFASFSLWRTGDLWLAVGIHTSWDWGQTYFYSVPDSGMMGVGHLFNGTVSGPAWLSGGSAGPEGSALNIGFWLLWFVLIEVLYRKRKWVGMDDRRRALAPPTPTVVIDTTALGA